MEIHINKSFNLIINFYLWKVYTVKSKLNTCNNYFSSNECYAGTNNNIELLRAAVGYIVLYRAQGGQQWLFFGQQAIAVVGAGLWPNRRLAIGCYFCIGAGRGRYGAVWLYANCVWLCVWLPGNIGAVAAYLL